MEEDTGGFGMARYLVGENANNFGDTLKLISDGDMIELDEHYTVEVPQNQAYAIGRSITIEGNSRVENGTTYINNTFLGKLYITNGAYVKIKNLWIKTNGDRNAVSVDRNASLELENCVLENDFAENSKVLLYANNAAKVILKDVWTFLLEGEYNWIKFVNSRVEIYKSQLNSGVWIEKSKAVIENTSVKYTGNCLNLRWADVELKCAKIEGGGTQCEKRYPAIYAENSQIVSQSSYIMQEEYNKSVGLEKNVNFSSSNDEISSISAWGSRIFLKDTRLNIGMYLQQASYAVAKGTLQFLREYDEKIDFLVEADSVFLCENAEFMHIEQANPNCRVLRNSLLKIQHVTAKNGDIANFTYEVDKDSEFIRPMEPLEKSSEVNEKETEGEKQTPLEELESLIGLKKVKEEIKKMLRFVEFNKKRIAQGLPAQQQSLHSVFMGNPGTGKTMVARLMGKILFEHGVLPGKEFIFIEAKESDLVSSNVGGTAEQTSALLEKARGGILFIDEAYTLDKKGANVNFGQEAINTILKYMEDYRNEIMIIFAGYTKEMECFLKTNPGLKSRVPNIFEFEDYSEEEILQLGEKNIQDNQYILEDIDYYEKNLAKAYGASLDKSNGRWVRNFNEKLFRAMANRSFEEDEVDVVTIKNRDIDEVLQSSKFNAKYQKAGALEELHHLVGIENVKQKVQEFIDLAQLNKKREEQGQRNADFTLHSLFLGNPGTGKTTVARIIGNVLYEKGVIRGNKCIEVSRSDLVAGFVGQTAIKTREVLESALGGVLFIDEAYTLSSGGSNDFGQEAINEILKFMEDHRRDIVIIFAGYSDEMKAFLRTNSGLTSRIPNIFHFEDYTPDEIVKIGLLGLQEQGYLVDVEEYSDAVKEAYHITNDHSNGRWIRNFNERLIRYMSSRVSRDRNSDVNTITIEDIRRIQNSTF